MPGLRCSLMGPSSRQSNFLIIAFVVFLLVKAVNTLKDAAIRKAPVAPAAPAGPTELEVLLQIRDQLAK